MRVVLDKITKSWLREYLASEPVKPRDNEIMNSNIRDASLMMYSQIKTQIMHAQIRNRLSVKIAQGG